MTPAGVCAGRAPVRVRPAPDVPWATYLDDDEPQPQQETPQHKAAATREDAGADRGVVGPKGHLPGGGATPPAAPHPTALSQPTQPGSCSAKGVCLNLARHWL
jgi:hypothetical protein